MRVVQESDDGGDEIIYRLGPHKMAKIGICEQSSKPYFHLRECYTVKDSDGKCEYFSLKKGYKYNLEYKEWCKLY